MPPTSGVLPYVEVADAGKMQTFLEKAFGAKTVQVEKNAKNHVVHACMKLPDVGVFEFSEAHKETGKKHDHNNVALYFFTKNAKKTHDAAVAAGAKSKKTAASSVFHGHVRSSVTFGGNVWRFIEADKKKKTGTAAAKKKPAAKKGGKKTAKKKPATAAKKAGKKAKK